MLNPPSFEIAGALRLNIKPCEGNSPYLISITYLQRGLGPVTVDPDSQSGPHPGMMLFAREAHDGTRWRTSRFWDGLPPICPFPDLQSMYVCTPYICHAIGLRSGSLRLGEVIPAWTFGSSCDNSH